MRTFATFKDAPKVITEAFKAEDWEAAIVMGFEFNNGRPMNDPNKYGIAPKVFDSIMQDGEIQQAGRKIASYVQNYFGLSGKENAEQYGRAKTSLTKFWSSFGAKDTTPKTDILIGDKRLSLKMGTAQLMSGGKAESTATFQAALQKVPEIEGSPQVQRVQAILEQFVTASLAPGQLRGIIKSGENEIVNAAEAAHKQCMTELNKLFEESNEFKIEFAREAMSGFAKYGDKSMAAAEFMLVATPRGDAQIHSVMDDAYCSNVANKINPRVRFKTSSRKVKGKKTGEYNYWSVVSLIVNAVEESIQEYNYVGQELTEGVVRNLADRAKEFWNRVWKKVTAYTKKGFRHLWNFLQPEPPTIEFKNDIQF